MLVPYSSVFGALSHLLLIVPFVVALHLWRKDKRQFFHMFSTYMLLSALVIGLKFALKIPRPTGEFLFDPYSFPSYHTAFSAALYPYIGHYALLLALVMGFLRVAAGAHTWVDVVGGLVLGLLAPRLYDVLRKKLGKEAARQSFHMGASALLALLLFRVGGTVLVPLLILGVVLYLLREKDPIRVFLEEYGRGESGRGAFTLVGGLLLAWFITPDVWKIAFFVGYVDGLATLSGRWAGRRGKSAEGFLGGLIGGVIASLCASTTPLLGILVALLEYVSRPPLDDNVTIAVGVAAIKRIFKL